MYSIMGVISIVLLILYEYMGYLFSMLKLQYQNVLIEYLKTWNHYLCQRKRCNVNNREKNNNYFIYNLTKYIF